MDFAGISYHVKPFMITMNFKPEQPFEYKRFLRGSPDKWKTEDGNGGVFYIKRVVEFIEDSINSPDIQEGSVIGVFGDWGTGKTSVLRGIEYYFKKEKYPALFFEAWRFHRDDNPLTSLLMEMANLTPLKSRFKKGFREIAELSIMGGMDIFLRAASLNILKIDNIRKYKKFKDELASETIDYLHSSFYRKFQKEFNGLVGDMLKDKGKERFILIIDDLDRCLPQRALELLEALRFHFQTKSTIIILGMNDHILGKCLEDQYLLKSGKPLFDGKDFLKKIVHWGVDLSRVEPNRLTEYLFHDMDDSVLPVFEGLDPLDYRTWIRIHNRFQEIKKEGLNSIYCAFEAVIRECYPAMEEVLRNQPALREMMHDNLDGIGSPQEDILIQFFKKSEEDDRCPFGKERGGQVMEKIQEAFSGLNA